MTESIERLLEIMAKLRDPNGGCPWDLEQNFNSIIPHTIEEVYEVVDAIEKSDMAGLKEELGDLLLQIVFYAQMANEQNLFSFDDVIQNLNDKLIYRHPHVFGDQVIKTAKEQEHVWEQLKKAKKLESKTNKSNYLLDEIPNSFPALLKAVKLQKKAAKVGFDWPEVGPIFDKIEEELNEVKEAFYEKQQQERIEEEIGDLLFAVCNAARHLKIDPDTSLRKANQKFYQRFCYIEDQLKNNNKNFEASSLEEMDLLWEQSKKNKAK